MAKTNTVTEQHFSSYRPLEDSQLKASTRKTLATFWRDQCKNLGVPFERDSDGYLLSIDTVGDDWLYHNDRIINVSAHDSDEFETIQLEALADSRETENEHGHLQFEIQTTKVEKLLADTTLGLLRGNPLYQWIEICYLPNSDDFIVSSGRHRLAALLTIAKSISGWEYLGVPVKVVRPRTVKEVADLVMTANGSRNMTKTESTMVTAVAKGRNLSVFRDPEEIQHEAAKASNISQLKEFARPLFISMARGSVMDEELTMNTLGDLGAALATQLVKNLDTIYKGTSKTLLYTDDDGINRFCYLMAEMYNVMNNNWLQLKEEIKEPVRVRGQVKVDHNGEAVYKCEVARKKTVLASFVAEAIVEKVGGKLSEIRKQDELEIEQAKKAKSAKKAASDVDQKIKQMESMAKIMEAQGLDTTEVKLAIEKLEQQKAQKAAATAQQEAQKEVEKSQLTELLQ